MNLNRAITRAKRIEDSLRERAFLPISETINGVTVRQLTLRHVTILFEIRSPFLFNGIRQIEDVGLFLWIVSPQYDTLPADKTYRPAFMSALVCWPRFHLFYRAIDRYLDRAFMDRPAIIQGGKRIATCYAAGIIHKIASQYHWSDEQILETPIARLNQFIKWIDASRNPNTPQFNPLQDKIRAREISRINGEIA